MRNESRKIYEKALSVIPGGVNSPVRAFPGLDMTPLIAVRGKGDTVFDADGFAYIDFCCSWGSLILGHANPIIVKEACEQIALGSSFGIATPVEEEFATFLVDEIPSLDKIRFVSSGTEATMSALRLARGHTGRSKIVKFDGHYHGHSDGLLIQAGSGVAHQISSASSKGVPQEVIRNTISLPFNETDSVRQFLRKNDDIAAVIVEPIAGNMGVVPADPLFLLMLREETRQKGILLIFDEVITGFRVAFGGAQELYDIVPDLSCYSKILGGGFPIGAFGGKKEIMDQLAPLGQVYQAGTLSGNPVAVRAGLTTLKIAQGDGFYQQLEQKMKILSDPIEALAKDLPICINRVGSMMTLFFGVKEVKNRNDLKEMDQEKFKEFFKYLFEKGIYIPPSPYEVWFVSAAHEKEHLERASYEICQFLKRF